jgi:putative oxidoreductase
METLSRLSRTRPGAGPWPLVVRTVAGVVFVGFSFGKFFRHQAEQAAFGRYGIPFSDTVTYLVGSLEFLGGLALVIGLLVRPFALALAGNMIGAISTAGRIDGGPVHLVLAPALLLGMVFLLWAGAGSPALDRRLARRCTDP